ncbi:MAG: hypothetical protein WCZ25_07945, partial [Aminobacteriaceae bacterium]
RAPPFCNRDVTASGEKEPAFFFVLTIEKEPPWAGFPAGFQCAFLGLALSRQSETKTGKKLKTFQCKNKTIHLRRYIVVIVLIIA